MSAITTRTWRIKSSQLKASKDASAFLGQELRCAVMSCLREMMVRGISDIDNLSFMLTQSSSHDLFTSRYKIDLRLTVVDGDSLLTPGVMVDVKNQGYKVMRIDKAAIAGIYQTL